MALPASSSTLSEPSMSRPHTYSRKQKSLGLLCSNFLSLYDRDGVRSIGLDDAASRLGVERRRIYDIVNVLESIGIIGGKNLWRFLPRILSSSLFALVSVETISCYLKRDDWEGLASTYRPRYRNKALKDLFSHYLEAWKSWCSEVSGNRYYKFPDSSHN